jgi:hypothetical protein
MWRIWVAKNVYVGGASRSKQPILEVLIDSSRDTVVGLVSTELGLGYVFQNPSPNHLPWRHCPSRRRHNLWSKDLRWLSNVLIHGLLRH